MEPANIDWKSIESRFVVDELYEHINAPKWIDFSAPEGYVDDEAWFCKPDCRHPKTAEDFLTSTPSSKIKHLRSVSISEILPLGDWNWRDANPRRKGFTSSSNTPIHDSKPEKTQPLHKFDEDSENENQNPNFSTPKVHHRKITKAEIKSSAEKQKPVDESAPSPADSSKKDRKPHLKSTFSARNLFAGREILNQITEFCNELKKLATRRKEREKSETTNVKLGGWDEREKEKNPLLQEEIGFSEAGEKGSNGKEKQRRKKRSEEMENIPIAVDLKNVMRGEEEEESLLQVRTCPPSPQCFSVPRGPNCPTKTITPLNPCRSKPPTQERGILQEVGHNKKGIKEQPRDKGNATSKSVPVAAGLETKPLDMFWLFKPCTSLT